MGTTVADNASPLMNITAHCHWSIVSLCHGTHTQVSTETKTLCCCLWTINYRLQRTNELKVLVAAVLVVYSSVIQHSTTVLIKLLRSLCHWQSNPNHCTDRSRSKDKLICARSIKPQIDISPYSSQTSFPSLDSAMYFTKTNSCMHVALLVTGSLNVSPFHMARMVKEVKHSLQRFPHSDIEQ